MLRDAPTGGKPTYFVGLAGPDLSRVRGLHEARSPGFTATGRRSLVAAAAVLEHGNAGGAEAAGCRCGAGGTTGRRGVK